MIAMTRRRAASVSVRASVISFSAMPCTSLALGSVVRILPCSKRLCTRLRRMRLAMFGIAAELPAADHVTTL